QGVRIPTITEVLEALPEVRLTVEIKVGAAQAPLLEAIRRADAADRVIVAAAADEARTLFGSYPGPTSASARQVRRFVILHRLGLSRLWRAPVIAVQIPEDWRGRQVLTPRMVRDFH